MAHEAGKGSVRRPSMVSTKQVDDNWDRIFGKKIGQNYGLDFI